MATKPLLYSELAPWWPLLSAPHEYREEAAFYAATLRSYSRTWGGSLLELGSGGGNNASHLKADFGHLTLVDLSPEMLKVSRALNPECDHRLGDMRTVRLGKEFDHVFLHDAVCYMTSLGDLRSVAETAFIHCGPGGCALFAPDHVRETFRPGTDHGGHDDQGRGLRYLEWTWDPDPSDTTYVVDYALMLRSRDGSVELRHDRHIEGLFSTAEWLSTLESAGFDAEVAPFMHSDVPPGAVVFVGVRPLGQNTDV